MLVEISRYFAPEDLSNGVIQTIGKEYLARYGERPKNRMQSLFHSNHELAKQLAEFTYTESDITDKWVWLTNIYRQLPNNDGELALTIRRLFEIAFHEKINLNKNGTLPVLKLLTEKPTHKIAKRLIFLVQQYIENKYERTLFNSFYNDGCTLI